MNAQPIINHPSTSTSLLLNSEFVINVIVRTKHEQRYWTSVRLKRDGLVSRAWALAPKRRQGIVYMRRPDVADKPIDIAGLSMCLHHSGTFGHLYNPIYGSVSICSFPTFSRRPSTMVNWRDPALLLKDYCASRGPCVTRITFERHPDTFIKFNHAVSGIYMCVCLYKQEIAP